MFSIIPLQGNADDTEKTTSLYYLGVDSSKVEAIQVISGGTDLQDEIDYAYYTGDPREINYIVHYFNSFALFDAGEPWNGSDSRVFIVRFIQQDGRIENYRLSGIFSNGYTSMDTPSKDLRKQYEREYKMSHIEYARFMELIHAFKAGDFQLTEPVNFMPSAWAKTSVDEAIQMGIVPKMNQIDYIKDINRLEFCQMAYALLYSQGVVDVEPEVRFEPFGDTLDPAVIALYDTGIIQGKTEKLFYPYDNITREEIAVILNRIYQFMNYVPLKEQSINYIDQEQISTWAVDSVKAVSAVNLMQGKEQMRFAPKDKTTKEESIVTLLRLYHLFII